MKLLKIILLFMALCLVVPVGAKKYKFDIDSQRNVVVKRSGSPGRYYLIHGHAQQQSPGHDHLLPGTEIRHSIQGLTRQLLLLSRSYQ